MILYLYKRYFSSLISICFHFFSGFILWLVAISAIGIANGKTLANSSSTDIEAVKVCKLRLEIIRPIAIFYAKFDGTSSVAVIFGNLAFCPSGSKDLNIRVFHEVYFLA